MDVEEPNLDNVADDADEPQADTTPKISKKDRFKKSPRPETLDPDWNTVKTVGNAPEQPWLNEMIQAAKPPLTFDELMSTPIDFSAFSMNRLKLNKITRADLVGPVFNILKGNKERSYSSSITKTPAARYTLEDIEDMIPTLWSPVIIAYDKDTALGISHWGPQRQQYYRAMINRKSKHEVFSTMRILSVVSVKIEKKSGYDYLEEIVIRRDDQKLYKFKEVGDVIMDFVIALKMFTRGIIVKNRVEDVQLVKESYTPNFDPPGVIYEDKSKKKRLMRIDEIYKFCDGTLQSVRNILRERLLNFKFGCNKGMPLRREWTEKDKRHTSIMLNKIDDHLFKRRVPRSLKVMVGGKKIETDKRLLQRTV
ncbi:hypothetical protein Tco_1393528 [Tanacetum coccineum]